ncbi:glucosamine-6-phosphate deaminase [Paenibacillus abyssi]|uniref:Glucosamine-6-phosphate deaminase n=1 Tax=Paenibacillus abyssi TaxID=1340531 RepID=A0A917LGB2_9BACL|nr:glucosamine-6-phosphate deaminase [Paenibacillus abyssi]GGG20789.1 glucosamine-6-phosphate deaminase [Paenibacillus abyssi]
MNIKIFEKQTDLDHYAADLIVETVKQKDRPVLGLATGSTPIGIYKSMVEKYRSGEVSFRSVTTYNLDEYVGLPSGHEQTYAYYMQDNLFQHIDIPAAQTFLPNGMASDLQSECRRYDDMLAKQPVDLQLLGLGHNGHIGFNEPSDVLTSGTHVAPLKESTRLANARFFNHLEEVPKQAITMGVGSILKAKTILLAVRGADKAAIVREALTGPITTECPASLLQTHANVIVLLDQDAGKELIANDPTLFMAHQ